MRTTIRTATRISGAVAGLAIGATILSGCALLPAHGMGDETTLSDTVTSVRIDDPSGSVSVSGETGATGIRIEREIKYWGNKRDIGPTYEVDGDELVLSGCGRRCTVEYSIELPAGVDVSGQTENGEIELSDVNNVEVSTSNGRIELEDVTGRVEVGTSNGRIEGSGLSGNGITAKTSNGSIELELATPQDVRASTSNGAIVLRVPAGGYEVIAETSLGGKNIDIASDPNGEFLLDLETSNGAITVRDSASSDD
ncbi:MAG TPA: DUF4097 family beta strand repeat-containing protein [Microterricola sp.]